ncbi:Lupus La protein [Trichoplax sp. H2]|nr:Lupus La protein [Trichoplax sp. H2]|eukprot:RDD37120.1 Lupus La protein [Trichoplax sp. H2]
MAEAEPSELELKIIKQIEFYFGDHNLPRDRFLQEKIVENNGWIPLSVLMTFNRLKSLSTDTDVIMAALKKSTNNVVEISEDGQSLQRSAANPIEIVTEDKRVDMKSRTVYVKGFPPETSLEQIENFITTFGQVNYIRMRRYKDRNFKGSIFVEFCKQEDAVKFVNGENITFQESELERLYQKNYYEKKRKERAETKLAKRLTAGGQQNNSDDEDAENDNQEEKEEVPDYEKGCIMYFKDVGEQTSREDLKEIFGEFESISFVDFSRNDTEGYIRFTEGDGATRAIEKVKEKNDGKIVIRDVESTVKVLADDEEKQYWIKYNADRVKMKEKRRKRKVNTRKDGNKKRFGKGRGKRGRTNDDNDDDTEEPAAKQEKTE